MSICNREQLQRSSDKSFGLLKCVLLNIQKRQNTEINFCLQHKRQLLSLDVISIYLDPELCLPSQNNGIKNEWKRISVLTKSRLPLDDKGSSYILFQ